VNAHRAGVLRRKQSDTEGKCQEDSIVHRLAMIEKGRCAEDIDGK